MTHDEKLRQILERYRLATKGLNPPHYPITQAIADIKALDVQVGLATQDSVNRGHGMFLNPMYPDSEDYKKYRVPLYARRDDHEG